MSKTTLLLKSKFILYNKQYSHGEQQGECESAFQWQVVAFHWVIGVLPLGLFGNCSKPGIVLQSEALVDSESKDPLVIKLSAYTSSDKGRRELGNHKHILVPWFCSGWNHGNDEFMLVEHWSGDFNSCKGRSLKTSVDWISIDLQGTGMKRLVASTCYLCWISVLCCPASIPVPHFPLATMPVLSHHGCGFDLTAVSRAGSWLSWIYPCVSVEWLNQGHSCHTRGQN